MSKPKSWHDGFDEGVAHAKRLMPCGHPRSCLRSEMGHGKRVKDGEVDDRCLWCEQLNIVTAVKDGAYL